MQTYNLNRLFTGPTGTYGRLGNWYTVELPWNNGDNHPDLSCILPGAVNFEWVMSPHFGFLVPRATNTPGRTLIELHPSNWISDLLGCIGIGMDINLVGGKLGVENSDKAFQQFFSLAQYEPLEQIPEPFQIVIQNYF
jgi:hypothetical protein